MLHKVAQVIQLSYQPAFDPFHAVFRLLRLREAVLTHGPLHKDHLKILDFYLLFPFRIDSIRLKRRHGKFRRLATQYESTKPYGDQPEDRVLFGRMSTMQSVALNTMAAKQLIDPKQYNVGEVVHAAAALPDDLAARIAQANEQEMDLIQFVLVLAREYDLLGYDGLKCRSGLMEYRYDAA